MHSAPSTFIIVICCSVKSNFKICNYVHIFFFQKKACQILYWILSNFIIRRVIFEQRFNCWAPSYSFFILEIAIKPKWGTVAAYVCSSRVDSTKRNLIRDYLVGSRSGPRTTALQCRRAIFGFAKTCFLPCLPNYILPTELSNLKLQC